MSGQDDMNICNGCNSLIKYIPKIGLRRIYCNYIPVSHYYDNGDQMPETHILTRNCPCQTCLIKVICVKMCDKIIELMKEYEYKAIQRYSKPQRKLGS